MSQLVSFLEAGMNSDIMSEVISQRSRNVERMETRAKWDSVCVTTGIGE